MCGSPIVQAAFIVACAALAVVLALLVARIDARRETRRRQRILADAIERQYQAQHFWRLSPDTERRKV